MHIITQPPQFGNTCDDCVYGRYHRGWIGDYESPPEPPYYTCHHPRITAEPYDPLYPPETFYCRYWLCRDAMDADACDAAIMSFAEWRTHWQCAEDGTITPR